jgi:hypothetical protein
MKFPFAKVALAAAVTLTFVQPGFAAEKAAGKPMTIQIGEQNGSGESGTAKLTPLEGGKTRVEISLKGESKNMTQPAHIHDGSCANLDPDNVVNGKSTTVVPVGMDELTSGKNAINVHKSTEDIKTYVACGDITASGKPAKK